MAKMHQIDWLFAIGTLFFILSLWGIGANVCLIYVIKAMPYTY